MTIEIIANVNSIKQAKELLAEVEVLNEKYEIHLKINRQGMTKFVNI
ncbi:hypothetical protein HCB41_00215 [Listeria welshimeri]|nr:hypothetical protein [Listeria welshimeri]MBC2295080.1 hypothetical protein [Listeria welshimeri]